LLSSAKSGAFTALVGPQESNLATWIHQDAWISLGEFSAQTTTKYTVNKQKNGIYLMVIEGEIQIGEQRLQSRDALGISETEQIDIQMEQNSKILVIEVPMN
jgi:redox-sensitive bicupin YhaK (pirin superfamily)